MNFKLVKKSDDHEIAHFQVVDSSERICGHINVPSSDVDALLKCWAGTTESPPKSSATKALTEAFMRARKK